MILSIFPAQVFAFEDDYPDAGLEQEIETDGTDDEEEILSEDQIQEDTGEEEPVYASYEEDYSSGADEQDENSGQLSYSEETLEDGPSEDDNFSENESIGAESLEEKEDVQSSEDRQDPAYGQTVESEVPEESTSDSLTGDAVPESSFADDSLLYEEGYKEELNQNEVMAGENAGTGHSHDTVTFATWTDLGSLPDTQGSYFLQNDVTLASTWNVPAGQTRICLNGKSITFTGQSGSVISVSSGADLELYDCTDTPGSIRGNSNNSVGVNVSGGNFTMKNGVITDNKGSNGGGVYIKSGAFIMSGGSITGNRADKGGGVYYEDGKFGLSGNASISGNFAGTANGGEKGDVYICNSKLITIEGSLTNTDQIGIEMQTPRVFTSGWNKTGKDPKPYFVSKDPSLLLDLNVKKEVLLFNYRTVIYYANGGTGTVPTDPKSGTYIPGDSVKVQGNTGNLTKAGFTFDCWNTRANGTGTDYKPGQTFAIYQNIPLYVKWKPNASFTGSPTLSTGLTYSGQPLNLVESDPETVTGGTMKYSTDKKNWYTKDDFKAVKAGTYPVYYYVEGDSTHGNGGSADDPYGGGNYSVTIAKAQITPVVIVSDHVYGKKASLKVTGNTGKGKVSYTYSTDLEGVYSSTVPVNAGTYYVKASVAATANYKSATSNPVQFTITRANITIKADNKSSAKGDSLKELTYSVSGEYVSGDDLGVTLSTTAKKTSAVGTYPITPAWKENPNYNATLKNGTYTITDKITAYEKNKAKISLNSAFKVKMNGAYVVTSWGKVSNAYRYDIYAAYCGHNFKKIKSLYGNSRTSYSFRKLGGKSVNRKSNVKVYVAVYRKVREKTTKITNSIEGHIAGNKSSKYTNVKEISLSKTSYTLGTGETVSIGPSVVLENAGKKQLSSSHCAQFRYASSNTAIATVTGKGEITAVKAGTCYIYVYAKNGNAKRIKVTVQ